MRSFGGKLSHLVIMARENGIPVLRVPDIRRYVGNDVEYDVGEIKVKDC